jgi:hypothetical protein
MIFMRDVLPTASVRYEEHASEPAPARPWPLSPGRCALGLSFLYVAAAAMVALQVTATPFENGWWLVAYLALVGGLAQALLVRGRELLLARGGARHPGWRWTEIVLWNVGALGVPLGVFSASASAVLCSSLALLFALGLYALGLRRGARAQRLPLAGVAAYYALVVFLAGSVLVGTGLASAFPWQLP